MSTLLFKALTIVALSGLPVQSEQPLELGDAVCEAGVIVSFKFVARAPISGIITLDHLEACGPRKGSI